MRGLLLLDDQLLPPRLPPSTAISSKGDAGVRELFLGLVCFPANAYHELHSEGEGCPV